MLIIWVKNAESIILLDGGRYVLFGTSSLVETWQAN